GPGCRSSSQMTGNVTWLMPRVSSWPLRRGSKANTRSRRNGGVVSVRRGGATSRAGGAASAGGSLGSGFSTTMAPFLSSLVDERGEDLFVHTDVPRDEVRPVGTLEVQPAAAHVAQIQEFHVNLKRPALQWSA